MHKGGHRERNKSAKSISWRCDMVIRRSYFHAHSTASSIRLSSVYIYGVRKPASPVEYISDHPCYSTMSLLACRIDDSFHHVRKELRRLHFWRSISLAIRDPILL